MRRAGVLLFSILACACSAQRHAPDRPPPAIHADATPVDPLLANDCLACHTIDLIRQQRLTDKQWPKSLEKMRTWGAPTEDDGVPGMLSALAASAPVGSAELPARTISAAEAASLFTVEADGKLGGGDASRGGALYTERCAPCHAQDGKGSRLGVALAGRHVLDRASAVAQVVRAGRGRMPEYPEATDAQVADLIAFLRQAH